VYCTLFASGNRAKDGFMTNHSSLPPTAAPVPSTDVITHWVEGYLQAWKTNGTADIGALFTDDAEYHEAQFATEWIGRGEIVEGWRSRWDWQQGGWTFEWSITSVDIIHRAALGGLVLLAATVLDVRANPSKSDRLVYQDRAFHRLSRSASIS
jgi:hypothetical protein